MKPEEREAARRLRLQGASVRDIAADLAVSRSSVSRWVRDLQLDEAQRAALAARDPSVVGHPAGALARAAGARATRLAWQEEGRAMARLGDPLHRDGCMLYWAEGTKARNVAALTNTDLDMLRVFCRFARESYRVADERLTLACNVHLNNGLALAEIERHWLDGLALPDSSLRASSVNRASSASRHRRNVLPYGTAKVAVHSTRMVQSIYGAIQEYAGFDRPEWLG